MAAQHSPVGVEVHGIAHQHRGRRMQGASCPMTATAIPAALRSALRHAVTGTFAELMAEPL